jgi:hypothetical protein
MKWLSQIFTDSQGSHDIARYLAALSVFHSLAMSGWDVIANHAHFDMQNFGMGIGAMFAGLGALLGFKKNG